MMIKICDGVPDNFKQLYWMQDYKKYGVSMTFLFNPFNNFVGVSFRKGKMLKSVIISPEETNERLAAKRFLKIEAEFGIPKEASKYGGEDDEKD